MNTQAPITCSINALSVTDVIKLQRVCVNIPVPLSPLLEPTTAPPASRLSTTVVTMSTHTNPAAHTASTTRATSTANPQTTAPSAMTGNPPKAKHEKKTSDDDDNADEGGDEDEDTDEYDDALYHNYNDDDQYWAICDKDCGWCGHCADNLDI
ncbi:hypothetical protein BDV95DRAFT_610319 [Massariosphaeria phaeospora]|uniref:Uncharacterized protein n=1 Tax=Massariosphaeria phaeospora TaxID=100035 RepID=A0A7C8M298_9PLEO|nr:hypothetical protein BDV95DRAFT_610319 [Massariosphaeria phaeospora]